MGDLINVQASTFLDLDSDNREESLRHFVALVHCKHAFAVMIEQVGCQRPEMILLAEFVRLTRRAYSHAKL